MNNRQAPSLGAWFILILAVFMLIGWAMNLNKLANCDFEKPYNAEIIHAAGLIPVVGMVTGWMDFGK